MTLETKFGHEFRGFRRLIPLTFFPCTFSQVINLISVFFVLLSFSPSKFLFTPCSWISSVYGKPPHPKPLWPLLLAALQSTRPQTTPRSPSFSSPFAWVCVVWLVRPLWFSSDPGSMRCGGRVSGEPVRWGWRASMRKRDIIRELSTFSEKTDPERRCHAKLVLTQRIPQFLS